jgi:hypothetical protein
MSGSSRQHKPRRLDRNAHTHLCPGCSQSHFCDCEGITSEMWFIYCNDCSRIAALAEFLRDTRDLNWESAWRSASLQLGTAD